MSLFMTNLRHVVNTLLFTIAVGFFTPNIPLAADSFDAKTLERISSAIFEVVVAKPTMDSLSYERPLPLLLLPYAIRTDNYYPIGTAFAIGPNEFVSASHVMNLSQESQFKEVLLRDKDGKVYSIDKIFKYSEHRDFVVFSLKDKIMNDFLAINPDPQTNQRIFAVGNALGQGIVMRDGLYTSNTAEDQEGEWKWIRFSAAASPGNSGGPLLDGAGKVIGVVLLKSPNENLNYALPIGEVIGAKSRAAAYRKFLFDLDIMNAKQTVTFQKDISLPKSYEELNQELIEGARRYIYTITKNILADYKGLLFPGGKGSSMVLHTTVDASFPHLLMKRDDGVWYAEKPKEIKESELGNNGYLTYGLLGSSLFFYIQKPDDIPIERFYGDSTLFMDTILKGIRLPRTVGQEQVKITSMGKAREDYPFTDSYGRKWQVRTWLIEYSDEKVVTFSLPVPGGCITIMRIGQTGLVNDGYIPDLRILTNFTIAPYEGTLRQWREFLGMKEHLPAGFESLNISFDYGVTFHYASRRLSLSSAPDLMEISEASYLKLVFGYFREGGRTVWDVAEISIGDRKRSNSTYSISRVMRPSEELGDRHQNEWNNMVNQKFPYNQTAYYSDKTTAIATVLKKFDPSTTPLFYTVSHSRTGRIDQKEMASGLKGFTRQITIHEDGMSNSAPPNWADAYHDSGDYYQALWDDKQLMKLLPKTADGYLLRGEVQRDKGDIDHALLDFAKAMEMDSHYIQTLFGREFGAFLSGAQGNFDRADRALEETLTANPFSPMPESLRQVAKDALAGHVKGDAARYLFRGVFLWNFDILDKAVSECDHAVSLNPGYAVAYDIRGLVKSYQKDRDGAIEDYRKALALNPRDVVAYNRMGTVHRRKGNLDLAIESFTKALELNPGYVKALTNRGGIFDLKGDYDRAIVDYDEALRLKPLYADAHFNRGLVLQRKGEVDKAIADFNKTIEIDPKFENAYAQRGNAWRARGDLDHAVADLTKAIEFNPNDDGAYNDRGVAYQKKGDLDKALTDYSRAIALNARNVNSYFNQGVIYHTRQELDRALSDYSKVIELNPQCADAYINRGDIFRVRGDSEQSLKDYGKAIELNTKNALVYFNRAFIHQQKRMFAQALSDYSKALEINPGYAEAYTNRGTIYKENGDRDRALSDYTKAIESNAKFDAAFFNRGVLKLNKGEIDNAIADFSTAIELNLKYVAAYLNRGVAYERKGDRERALSEYNRALEIDSKSALAYNKRGALHSGKGDVLQAISDLNSAIAIDPNYAEAYDNRGIAFSRKGDYVSAMADFTKAIEIDPSNASAYSNRGFTLKVKGEIERALADFDKSLQIKPDFTLAYINRGNTYAAKQEKGKACADWRQACILGSCESITLAKKTGYCSE